MTIKYTKLFYSKYWRKCVAFFWQMHLCPLRISWQIGLWMSFSVLWIKCHTGKCVTCQFLPAFSFTLFPLSAFLELNQGYWRANHSTVMQRMMHFMPKTLFSMLAGHSVKYAATAHIPKKCIYSHQITGFIPPRPPPPPPPHKNECS